MERKLWTSLMVLSILLLRVREIRVSADPQVPCYFAFGDSTADNGNNNDHLTFARINYRPYGIDFPCSVPTGRYTNGRNLVDFIAKFLGFRKFIPPFATANEKEILRGVNYAIGAAGIRNESGQALGITINFYEQIANHESTIRTLIYLLGRRRTEELLKKCIYTVNLGSNDYGSNYFLPFFFPSSRMFTPEQYAVALIKQYSSQLQLLYKMGARKVALFGVGALGCTPYARSSFPTDGRFCAEQLDNIISLFNVRLRPLVDNLNANLPGAMFTFINSTVIPISGFSSDLIVDTPCCQVGNPKVQCISDSTPCRDRRDYLFWDGVHFTEVGYSALALAAYNSTLSDAFYPYSISQLALHQTR